MPPKTLTNRLTTLKSISEQLKQSTSYHELNLPYIKELLINAKGIYEEPPFSKNSAFNLETYFEEGQASQQSPLLDIKQLLLKQTDSQQMPQLGSIQQKDETNSHLSINQVRQLANLRQQIKLIRTENINITSQLATLSNQKEQVQSENQQLEQILKKHTTPYFQFSHQLECFVCRIQIPPQGYNKVEYSIYQISLKLDKLVLVRKEKQASLELQLTGIIQVYYPGKNSIVLRFLDVFEGENNDVTTTLFIKFQSQDVLHKWDLGIYSNYQISKSISKEKLFKGHFNKKVVEIKPSQEPKKQQINPNASQKELYQMLVSKREDYLKIKDLINEKLVEKINNKKEGEQPDANELFLKQILQGLSPERFKARKKLQQSQKKRLEAENRHKLLQKEKQTQISKQAQQQEYLKKVRENLVNGYELIKYSKDGFSPHNKRVFLSNDFKKLCWSETDKVSEYKAIFVSSIKSFKYPAVGQGIIKHINKPRDQLFCVIKYMTTDQKEKTIELGSQDREEVKSFSQDLKHYLDWIHLHLEDQIQ